jgi:hypothetical protein
LKIAKKLGTDSRFLGILHVLTKEKYAKFCFKLFRKTKKGSGILLGLTARLNQILFQLKREQPTFRFESFCKAKRN